MTHHSTTRHAFTLVELLVVIGIIALLISILLPTLSRAQASAQSVNCLSNLRQTGAALVQYANDERYWLPSVFGDDPVTNYPGRDPKWYAYIVLGKYAGSGSVLSCPSDDTPVRKTGDFNWQAPEDYQEDEVFLSYQYNGGWDREFTHRLLSSIKGATEVRAVGDGGEGNFHNGSYNFENAGSGRATFRSTATTATSTLPSSMDTPSKSKEPNRRTTVSSGSSSTGGTWTRASRS